MTTSPTNDEQLREAVREHYGRTALEVLSTSEPKAASCCGPDCCGGAKGVGDAVSSDLYSNAELGELPLAAALASLGCGNPTALAALKPGEKVLDLGSGGGIDVLLSARRVGPTGFAYGLDMTDAMLELAERNRAEARVENVRFLKGVIEDIPLPTNAVDVVISNCVINLSADKRQVLREAYRVLVPGGRFAVSDIVYQGHIPQVIRADLEAWAGCIAGALEEESLPATTCRGRLYRYRSRSYQALCSQRYRGEWSADIHRCAFRRGTGGSRGEICQRLYPRS